MFATVMVARVLSAPGNELRAYRLQPPDCRQSFRDFFQPLKVIESVSVGAVIMGAILAIGTMATPQVENVGILAEEEATKDTAAAVKKSVADAGPELFLHNNMYLT